MNKNRKTHLRIIWAVAAKDMADAFRSKTIISIILSVMLTTMTGQALPWLLKLRSRPTAAVYDAGDARLVDALRQHEGLSVYKARSQSDMESMITERSEAILGLAIPADFDDALAAGENVTLEGYVAHWVTQQELAELTNLFEQEITDITKHPVTIDTTTARLYPTEDTGGQPVMMTMSLVVATVLICTVMVPHLMIDEKETHTLDALLVSPAGAGEVVAGKAIAGALYGLIAGGVALLLGRLLIAHWWVAGLVVVSGVVFSVGVGLVLGSFFDNAQNMSIWMGAVMMIMLVPIFADMMTMSESWPAIVRNVLPQLPTALMARLFRISFTETVRAQAVLGRVALILLWSAPLYALVVWRVRRLDR